MLRSWTSPYVLALALAALCAVGLVAPARAQSPPIEDRGPTGEQARRTAFAKIQGLMETVRKTPPRGRVRLLVQLEERCGAFLDTHLEGASPEELGLVASTWLQLAAQSGATDALRKRLATLRGRELPPDLLRQVRFHSARLAVKVGARAPGWSLPVVEGSAEAGKGGALALSALRGRVALIEFGSPRHPDWRAFRERKLEGLHTRYAGREDFALVGIVVSTAATTEAPEPVTTPWPRVEDTAGVVALDYGVADVPFLCLIDPEGKVLAVGPGWKTLAEVERLLAERFDPPPDEDEDED